MMTKVLPYHILRGKNSAKVVVEPIEILRSRSKMQLLITVSEMKRDEKEVQRIKLYCKFWNGLLHLSTSWISQSSWTSM